MGGMLNHCIYIVGPPGVGKYTVGSMLAERMPAKFVDNHYWLNPVFGLIEQDGIRPIPRQLWEQVHRLRGVVMDTIATLSPDDWNFVFTLALEQLPRDHEIAREILVVADRRRAKVLIVRLACALDELAARIVMPERRSRFKEADPMSAYRNANLPLFDVGDRETITIDTTGQPAHDTVAQIMEKLPLR